MFETGDPAHEFLVHAAREAVGGGRGPAGRDSGNQELGFAQAELGIIQRAREVTPSALVVNGELLAGEQAFPGV